MSDMLIFGVGLSAQLLFGARMIIQWVMSERQREVLSPVIFWRLSLFASMLMMIYGYLRLDAAIILGQLITYFIYIRNLQLEKNWRNIWIGFRIFIATIPFLAIVFIARQDMNWQSKFIDSLPLWLILFGIAGQLLFTIRFIIQYYISEKHKKSVLPPIFWWVSSVGALMIIVYGWIRSDWVLIIGNAGGMISYVRNIIIGRNNPTT